MLAGHFDTLQQVAAEAGLSSRAVEKLAKASRVLDAMNATIAFFWKARRADGTTAARRFYGTAPRDVFAWLLDRLSVPARPRARRHAA